MFVCCLFWDYVDALRMCSLRSVFMCNLLDTKSMFSPCILIPLFILLDCRFLRAAVVRREVRCPVFWDAVWQYEDSKCPQGKRYHCFENEDGEVVVNDCYTPRTCLTGSHPVVEITGILCSFCEEGFQPQEKLESYDYSFSYCGSHSPPCRPEYGQSECLSATRDRDRACTCNATLGFEPKLNAGLCTCFTPNDPCTGCRFVGCPLGRVRNDRGFCEQEEIKITSAVPATPRPGSTSPPPVNTKPSGGSEYKLPVWIIVSLLVVAVLFGVGVFVFQWRRMKKKKSSKTYTLATGYANGESLLPLTASTPDPPQSTQTGGIYVVERVDTLMVSGDVKDFSVGRAGIVSAALKGTTTSEVLQNNPPTSLPDPSAPPASLPDPSAPPASLPDPSAPPASLPDPSAPPASLPDPSAPPASLPDPSAPPASLPDPSAPPASLPDPSAPPASLPDPSAPPASLPDPSAPPLSLPDPSAPHASWPCEDRGQMEEETDASPSDTAVKTGRQQEIDATSSPQDADEAGETEVKTPLLADQEQTLTKVVSPAGDSNESTFTHNTQVKTVHGDSGVPQHFAVAEDESNDVDLNERF